MKTMDNGAKVVDINEVVFVEDQYIEDEDNDNGMAHRRKRRKKDEVIIMDDNGTDDDEESDHDKIGLLDSNDFIPDDIFKESLQTGKRVSELLAERASKQDQESSSTTDSDGGMVGLILTPTRELAMQIKTHIDAVAKYTGIKVRHVYTV